MPIIVQKYGGTSVGSVERMRHVADLIISERNQGHHVVVISSAMAGVTNQLVKSATQFNKALGTQAYDFVISNGENVSCGMLSLALAEKGITAKPLAGWQVPIITNDFYSRARIQNIPTENILDLLKHDIVPVITGFQGLGPDQSVTTLGRGGSDTSAVAIAASLKAERCDIYTDIDGIYTADPRYVPDARFIKNIPSKFALLMAKLGAKIIHPSSVEWAMKYDVPLRILSSFGSNNFTTLMNGADHMDINCIAHMPQVVFVEISILSKAVAEKILEDIYALDIPLDMVDMSENHLIFSMEASDLELSLHLLTTYEHITISPIYSKISIVGQIHPSLQDSVLKSLTKEGIEIKHSYVDTFRLSVLINQDQLTLGINRLHRLVTT